NRARLVQERHEDVQAARGHAAESTETLNQHHSSLRHDLDRFQRNDQQDYADEEKKKDQHKSRQHSGVTLQEQRDCKRHGLPPIKPDLIPLGSILTATITKATRE